METAIVIGYGNELRGDDAIGQMIARIIKSRGLLSVKSIAVHQLTPELSEPLASARLAIFVDACVDYQSDKVKVISLLPSYSQNINGHICDPQSLLYLAKFLYNNCPETWLITVPGVNFELSDQISPTAEKGMEIALTKIMEILN
jgi:hydrogenase maturation protease